jgi:hypothetical protein
MLQRPDPAQVSRQLGRQLRPDFPTIVVPRESVPQALVRRLSFSPDICLRRGDELIFVHLLAAGEIPEWVSRARTRIARNLNVLLLAAPTETKAGTEIASEVAEEAQRLRFGLAVTTADATLLIFPPNYRPRQRTQSRIEVGHIPRWLYERAAVEIAISPRLRTILEGFRDRYARATTKHQISYNFECRILGELAESIAAADPRLFFPLERLQVLRSFERSQANIPQRDHFFHTFNNLFLGLIILDELFAGRSHSDFPDNLIAERRNRSRLKLWESLWFLTALFHDEGYIPEHFWSLLSFGFGLQHDPSRDNAIPTEVRQRVENNWNTEWLQARGQLRLVYRSVSDVARKEHKISSLKAFDEATRLAYFDGKQAGHSLFSGLTLIQHCLSDNTVPHQHFSKPLAVTACNVACLSMLFHDQRCREILKRESIAAIPFQYLPYAAVLMFVDALQDDRRDVSTSRFRARGVLDSLSVDPVNGLVTARVALANLPIRYWPYKIAEYENVMNWINPVSRTKFIVDYVR